LNAFRIAELATAEIKVCTCNRCEDVREIVNLYFCRSRLSFSQFDIRAIGAVSVDVVMAKDMSFFWSSKSGFSGILLFRFLPE